MKGANVLHSHNPSIAATVPLPDESQKLLHSLQTFYLHGLDASASILKKQLTQQPIPARKESKLYEKLTKVLTSIENWRKNRNLSKKLAEVLASIENWKKNRR